MMKESLFSYVMLTVTLSIVALDVQGEKRWLAGDHHVHSQFSVGWDDSVTPPKPVPGGDAVNPIPDNASLARNYGLAWMVTTDHGGPSHSKVNRDLAYPELLVSRKQVPEVLQFYGMELNTPAADHSSLIIPYTLDEREVLFELEKGFDKREAFPFDLTRDMEDKMLEALVVMRELSAPPIIIANHPSRSASDYGEYGLHTPTEFRKWNNLAPNVAVGMAGAPGHQAGTLVAYERDGVKYDINRGAYRSYPTMGGFDQMTAKVGGVWDSMLGEGRRWWITANSDFHRHFSIDGIDFYPGEYSKTYVYAEKNHDAIFAALRSGKVFVTTGDLVSEVNIRASLGDQSATMGSTLPVPKGAKVYIEITVRDPSGANANKDMPAVNRVDLITGDVNLKLEDLSTNSNSSAVVNYRFSKNEWQRDGEVLTMSHRIKVKQSMYLRIRGTNTSELEPLLDGTGESPWGDLWFYTNPVFIAVE